MSVEGLENFSSFQLFVGRSSEPLEGAGRFLGPNDPDIVAGVAANISDSEGMIEVARKGCGEHAMGGRVGGGKRWWKKRKLREGDLGAFYLEYLAPAWAALSYSMLNLQSC